MSSLQNKTYTPRGLQSHTSPTTSLCGTMKPTSDPLLWTSRPVLDVERSAGDMRHVGPYFDDERSISNATTSSSSSIRRSSTTDHTYQRADSERRADKPGAIEQPYTDDSSPGAEERRLSNGGLTPRAQAAKFQQDRQRFERAFDPHTIANKFRLSASPPWKFNSLFGEFVYQPSTDRIIPRIGQPYCRPPNTPIASLSHAIWKGFEYTGSPRTLASVIMLQSGPLSRFRPLDQNITPGQTAIPRPRGRPNDPHRSRARKGENRDTLHPDYKLRPAKFSKVGGAFSVLLVEPTGRARIVDGAFLGIHLIHFGERLLSKVRRFVVVAEGSGDCTALAITTHSGQGVVKQKAVEFDHAISYAGPNSTYNIGSERTQSRARCPDTFPEPTISGLLRGINVSAFPDTGAAANYISLPYTQRHGLAINRNVQKSVKVGDGSVISIVGTATLPFSFAGESTKHNLTFHVLRNSIHDIILGSTFLRVTETFTRFTHRVGRKIRESVSRSAHRICFLGSEQYVNGLASGVRVDAVPDTGADVSVMSAEFAKANGFEVDDDEQHQILLEFADGSTARAHGVVADVAWEFGADEKTSPTDVYVLSSLPVDLVLGFGFLCQTEAFREHWHNFWNIEDPTEEDDAGTFCVIRVLKEAGEGTSCEYRCGVVSIRRLYS
jgi:hypothetical protein